MSRRGILLSATVAILSLGGVSALAATGVGPFTQAQVTAGRADFLSHCAECHNADLGGFGDAPTLTGQNFNTDFGNSTPKRFYQFVYSAMPQGMAGAFPKETYYNIISFLLAANGAKPGPTPFAGESDVRIGDIADGQTVAAVVNGTGANAAPKGKAP